MPWSALRSLLLRLQPYPEKRETCSLQASAIRRGASYAYALAALISHVPSTLRLAAGAQQPVETTLWNSSCPRTLAGLRCATLVSWAISPSSLNYAPVPQLGITQDAYAMLPAEKGC